MIVLVAVGTGSGRRRPAVPEPARQQHPDGAAEPGRHRRPRRGRGFGALFGGGGGARAAPRGGGAGGAGGWRLGGTAATGSVSTGTQTRVAQLTLDDAHALTDKAPGAATSPRSRRWSRRRRSMATYQGATHTVASFVGHLAAATCGSTTTPSRPVRPFTDDDWVAHRRVALLGPTVAKDLVGGDGLAAVGTTVQFNAVNYTVVGVLAAKGSTGPNDADDRVLAPLTAVQDTLDRLRPLSSDLGAGDVGGHGVAAQAEVQDVLNGRHHVAAATADYSIFNASSILLGGDLDDADVHGAARRGGGDLAARRRHRRHEHHAGDRHRADPRDRHPQGGRRPAVATSSGSS